MRTVIWPDRAELRARLDAEFGHILARLDERTDIEQVWLFGSTLDGEVHTASDLDILVVQRTDLGPIERAVDLRVALATMVPVDLFVLTPRELADGGRFVDHVRAHGRRVR